MKKPATVHRSRKAGNPACVRGGVLIEALAAMLIFVLGVLGVVGLQTKMTQVQSESKVRSEAAFLASEVIGRMWADLTNAPNYNGAGCAAQDPCREWQGKVANSLPKGTGTVAVDAATGDVAVTITWRMPSGDTHQYVTHTTVVKAGG